MLAPVFPMNLIEQEVSSERWIDIPEEVLELLYRWRPSPSMRAVHLEQALGTPARIYYKNESVSPRRQPQAQHRRGPGLVQQAVRDQAAGDRDRGRPVGQRPGLRLLAPGLECKVFMVRVSFDQKPFRKLMMETWGATAWPAPAKPGPAGISWPNPDTPGSLGIAISEAIEAAVTDPQGGQTRYSLGSVLNHVMLHQTIIGLEAKKQLEKAGERKVDVVIGCAGGGSNFAGLAFPFVADKIHGARIDHHPGGALFLPHADRGPLRLRPRRHGRK
jgi:tryptophan synthase beta chain